MGEREPEVRGEGRLNRPDHATAHGQCQGVSSGVSPLSLTIQDALEGKSLSPYLQNGPLLYMVTSSLKKESDLILNNLVYLAYASGNPG